MCPRVCGCVHTGLRTATSTVCREEGAVLCGLGVSAYSGENTELCLWSCRRISVLGLGTCSPNAYLALWLIRPDVCPPDLLRAGNSRVLR